MLMAGIVRINQAKAPTRDMKSCPRSSSAGSSSGTRALASTGISVVPGNVVLLVRPDLMGIGILFVDDPDAIKHSPFDLEGGEFLLKAGKELIDELLLACALEIVDMRAEDQHESLSRGVPGTGK